MRPVLAVSIVALLAIAASGCETPLPPEARGGIVVPPTPQSKGAGAPLVAPTHPYETSGTTQQQQQQSGYFAAAGEPLVQEQTNYGAPAHEVDRSSMRDVLLVTNPAVYSNSLLMSRPNLYEDPASYQAWVASQTMAGGTEPSAAAHPVKREATAFFDWDKAHLTPAGGDLVDKLAAQAKSEGATEIMVVGKADRSGSEAHNLRLSQRRAEVVRDRLIAQGIAPDQIDTHWVGENEPPVPTANGVREPRNRVVTLTMTTMAGATEAPQPARALPRRVLFTTTENSPPGAMGQELPGAVANGSVGGQAAAP